MGNMQLANVSCYFTVRDDQNDFETGSKISITHIYIHNIWFHLTMDMFKSVWRVTLPNLQGFSFLVLWVFDKNSSNFNNNLLQWNESNLLPCIVSYVWRCPACQNLQLCDCIINLLQTHKASFSNRHISQIQTSSTLCINTLKFNVVADQKRICKKSLLHEIEI